MKRIHLIGICGTGMASLAVMLKERGLHISGSDEHIYPPMSDMLLAHGIIPLKGYRAEHVSGDLDTVVIGNAVSRGNPEVEEVLDQALRYVSFPEFVREEFLRDSKPIVVAGTHGKTTTAFMTAWTLAEFGLDPSFLVGGMSNNFGKSGHLGQGSTFVLEGDEYDSAFFDKTAKFLKYIPRILVLNGVEFDHADIYRDFDELKLAFRRLIQLLPRSGRVLLCADNEEAVALGNEALCPVETFGLDPRADWRATSIRHESTTTVFDVSCRGENVTRIALPLLGTFNVRNALAATAAAAAVDVPPSASAAALARFKGVRRRLEVCGVVRGITVYDDFAHHPTAISETLTALRSVQRDGRIWAIFEPRSATACRRVFQQTFVNALAMADEVIVAATYRSALPDHERLSERRLIEDLTGEGVSARHIPFVEDIVGTVAEEARGGDCVVVMSNGNFAGLHGRLVDRLKTRVKGSR